MKRILLISAAALLTSGCVTSTVRKAEVTPPPAYESPTPNPGGLATAALDNWWALYGDAQLNALVDEALRHAPDARTALAVLDQAAAVRSETLDKIYIPSGEVQGSGTRTQTSTLGSSSSSLGQIFAPPGATESFSATFDVSWELDLFGRRAAARRGADADFYNAAFTYEATRTSLIADVADSLFQARGLAIQMQDALETARIERELAHISDVQLKAGLVASADVDQSLAQAEAAEAQAESFRAQLLAAQRSLLVLIGHGFDKVESLPASAAVGVPPAVPATLKTDDLSLLPTINLQPDVSITKTTGPFGYSSAAWSIGAALAQPVLDRPRLIAQIHAQRAVAEQDVIAYEKAVQTAYGDVETAFTYLDSDARRVRMLTEAEHRAESAYEKARLGYARGFTDLTAALQAETTWRSVRSQLSSAQITLMERSVQTFKALGGGWSPDRPAAATLYAAKAERGVDEAKGVR